MNIVLKVLKRLIFPAALAVDCFLWRQPILATVLLLILSGLAIWIYGNIKVGFFIWLTGVVLGPVAEIIAVWFGAWSYALPLPYVEIPLWLPATWGLAGLFFARITGKLNKKFGTQ